MRGVAHPRIEGNVPLDKTWSSRPVLRQCMSVLGFLLLQTPWYLIRWLCSLFQLKAFLRKGHLPTDQDVVDLIEGTGLSMMLQRLTVATTAAPSSSSSATASWCWPAEGFIPCPSSTPRSVRLILMQLLKTTLPTSLVTKGEKQACRLPSAMFAVGGSSMQGGHSSLTGNIKVGAVHCTAAAQLCTHCTQAAANILSWPGSDPVLHSFTATFATHVYNTAVELW